LLLGNSIYARQNRIEHTKTMVFSHNQVAQPATINTTTMKYEEPDWYPANNSRQQRRDARQDVPSIPRGHVDGERTIMPGCNERESRSYSAAIKAVNDAMSTGGDDISVLRGLWRVFDAGIGELGSELNDSLSSKAIFEGKSC
jgi:hypothetical protein